MILCCRFAVDASHIKGVKSINGKEKPREIILGRNVHTTCLEVTELDADDEVTGERESYMASVLARYRKSLLERTKHHLEGNLHGILVWSEVSPKLKYLDYSFNKELFC
ncbi:unnamed protein product [Lactuca virosa]|uniref:Uncharacterized protein n=1 Tax=Lactuca virosa TaxID=75947 RepID=A0AAU9PAJ6_9ASTR|nr:unnamed protein product [Lactuca virosa]